MAIQIGVAVQRCAVEHAFQFVLGRDHMIAEGGREGLEGFAVVPMHGEIDAETLLGMVDEFLAENRADVERRDALAVTDDRRDCEDAERIAALFDADEGFAVRSRSTTAERRDEISSPNALGSWTRRKIVAGGRIRFIKGMPCVFSAFDASPRIADRASRSPLRTASATGGKADNAVLTAIAARPS